MDRRAQLQIWIAQTRRNQRRIAVVTGVLAALSIVAGFVHRPAGTIGFIVTVSFALVSFWVTTSHLADWRHQLEHLAFKQPRRRA
jgi:hypothetical protein